ncbi:nucleoside diphosphate kinase 6-like [Sinocyclocheilus rhinocerous]|uniref:nucleoside diphosphate kinase 6-like n=1 Tax=Sinocyclocheilus rhinocerous TaxID=307959 RepID=UPI0007B81C4A|nr:PREDICTED: nucleoside diphosphate kinase 6-like [Sinocyclocheilus rhinocerous]
MRCVKALQLTLAVVKPDAVAHPLILEALHQKILENFIIVRKKDLMWRTEDSEKFYAEHAGRFFYQRLVEFMSRIVDIQYIYSVESAKREISFFFPEFNADEWMSREEPRFRLGLTEYDEERQIHTLQDTC